MFKRYLLHYPPEVGAGSGGTTDNSTATSSGASSTEGSVSSGTASDAMIAAYAASSAAEEAGAAGTAGIEVPTGEAAAEAAAETAGAQVPTGAAAGEAPPSRIEAAVRNARAAVEQQYAWAKDLDPTSVKTAFDIARNLMSDTRGFAEKLAGELGLKLVAANEAAPVTAAPAAATGGAFKLPKARLTSEDGQGAYSEEQMGQILTDFAASLRAEFGGQLKPVAERQAAVDRAAKIAEVREEARASVTEMMTGFRARPHFQTTDAKGQKVDHPEILKNLMAIPQQERNRIGPEAAIYRAYTQFLQEKVFPTIGTTAAASVRDENARKEAASRGNGHPVGGAGNTGGAPVLRNVSDLAKHMEKLAGQSATP